MNQPPLGSEIVTSLASNQPPLGSEREVVTGVKTGNVLIVDTATLPAVRYVSSVRDRVEIGNALIVDTATLPAVRYVRSVRDQ